MNKVILVGRVSTEIECRTANNQTIAKFRIAVDRKYKDNETDFINCVAFGKTAELLDKYSAKGKRLGVEGRIQTGSYSKQDGTKVYTTDVIVESIDIIEFKDAPKVPTQNSDPTYQAPPYQQAPTQMSMEGFMQVSDNDEGIPFK